MFNFSPLVLGCVYQYLKYNQISAVVAFNLIDAKGKNNFCEVLCMVCFVGDHLYNEIKLCPIATFFVYYILEYLTPASTNPQNYKYSMILQ